MITCAPLLLAQMLTIITPCSRPENLRGVLQSIDFNVVSQWIIVHDTKHRPFIQVFPNDEKIHEYPCTGPPGSTSGNAQRNFGLELVHEGYVYFLDDDNLVHPNFYTEVVPNLRPKCILTFDMQYANGGVLRGASPRPRQIDTAMVVFDRATCAHLRWTLHEYIADGLFIEALVNLAQDHWTYVPKVAAWYNRLRD